MIASTNRHKATTTNQEINNAVHSHAIRHNYVNECLRVCVCVIAAAEVCILDA